MKYIFFEKPYPKLKPENAHEKYSNSFYNIFVNIHKN